MRGKTSKNKRKTCSMKYKIKKRVSEHRRRVKKEAKKAKVNGVIRRNVRNTTPIPNSFPDKRRLMEEQENFKKRSKIENKKEKIHKNREEIPDLVEE